MGKNWFSRYWSKWITCIYYGLDGSKYDHELGVSSASDIDKNILVGGRQG